MCWEIPVGKILKKIPIGISKKKLQTDTIFPRFLSGVPDGIGKGYAYNPVNNGDRLGKIPDMGQLYNPFNTWYDTNPWRKYRKTVQYEKFP